MITSYTSGMPYESLIRRAFKCQRGAAHGAESAYMTNLIDAEDGKKQFKLGTAEQQLIKVKDNIAKALDKFLTFKLSQEESSTIMNLKYRTELSMSSSDLLQIIEQGLSVTLRFNS